MQHICSWEPEFAQVLKVNLSKPFASNRSFQLLLKMSTVTNDFFYQSVDMYRCRNENWRRRSARDVTRIPFSPTELMVHTNFVMSFVSHMQKQIFFTTYELYSIRKFIILNLNLRLFRGWNSRPMEPTFLVLSNHCSNHSDIYAIQ